jgi:hypothetical protein
MKPALIVGIAAIALLSNCKNPFDSMINDATSGSSPFKITATVNGSSFSAGGTCAVQPYPSGGDLMSVSATQVNVSSSSTATITLSILAATGRAAPFSISLNGSPNIGAYTENSNNTYSTENGGSGNVSTTYWASNANGTGYAEGTFSFIAKSSTGQTVTVTGGTIKKN